MITLTSLLMSTGSKGYQVNTLKMKDLINEVESWFDEINQHVSQVLLQWRESYLEPNCALSLPRPRLPDEEPFELKFEPSLNALKDNVIHSVQNIQSNNNSRRPDSGKYLEILKKPLMTNS